MAEVKHSGKIPAKPGKDVVYLDVDDEITGIIDKVEGAKEKVVALVLPKRSTSLQSIVNMRLLRRSADTAGKNVVLITKEAAILPLAGAAGLHVAESLQGRPEVPPSPRPGVPPKAGDIPVTEETDLDAEPGSAKLDYHRSVGELATAKDEEEEIALGDEEEKDDKPAKAAKTPGKSKVKVPNFDRFRLMLGLGILAFILLIVFIILAIFVLPKATIDIQTSSTPVSANFNLTTSDSAKALDETGGIIPASLKSSDFNATESVTATGQQNNGTKATGSVTMTATECAPSIGAPDDVPAGTGISTNGLTFITQGDASFSINGSDGHSCVYYKSNSVNIVSQQAGAKYNTTLNSASVAGYSSVSASGSASGGTDNIQTVVSQADLDTAKAKVSSSDTDNFSKSFQNGLTKTGLYIIPSTLKAADPVVTATPALGQPASTVSVTIKITYSALTVEKSDLQKAITDVLQKQIKDNEQKITGDVVQGADITVENQSSPTVATLSINENTTAAPVLNFTSIKNQSAGKKSGDIADNINALPGVKGVTVHLSPFWVSKAPKASKITVVQQQVKGGS